MSFSLSQDEAAPPPSIRSSARQQTSRIDPPRQSSTSDFARPFNVPPRQSRSKGPNDVRVKPASPDVISDLLDSFNVISTDSGTFPSPIASPRNASRPRSPTKSSRPPSRGSQRPPSIKPSNLTHEFTEVPHPTENPAELPPEEDAAEPPVIRTARRPSGYSKISAPPGTTQGSTVRRKLSSPRIMLSPPPERATDQRPPSLDKQVARSMRASRDVSPTASSQRSPQKLDSVRESMDYALQDEYSLGDPGSPGMSKGKERDVYSESRPTTRRSDAYDRQRAEFVRSPPPSRGQQTATKNNNKPEVPQAMTFDTYRQQKPFRKRITDDDPPTPKAREPSMNGSVRGTPITQNGHIVPERRSSLVPSESPSPVKRRSSFHSSKSSPEQRRKKAPPIAEEKLPTRVVLSEDSDNDETLRRIKQLKAAREMRRGSMKEISAPKLEAPRTLTMPTGSSQGVTAKSSRNLREAPEVEEHRISDEIERDGDHYALGAPMTVTAPSKPFGQSAAHSSLSNRKYREANGGPGYGNSKSSFETPRHSRQNSRSKRWSPMAFQRTESAPRHSTGLRPQSPGRQTAAGAEERRSTVDEIAAEVEAYLALPKLSQKVQIPGERRKVAFSEVGDPKGHVILVCVGMGLTRYIMSFYDELATSLGLRLITLDRPGIGESDPYPEGSKTPMAWPDDVLAICDKLHITKFSILAHSAGAVYALATALRLPHFLRGKIHLLAPWIPPSQLQTPASTINNKSATPAGTLPRSQRFLRILPSSFLRLSNSSFGFSSRSSSPKPNKSSTPKRSRRSTETGAPGFNAQSQPNYPSSKVPSGSISTTNLAPAPYPDVTRDNAPTTPRLDSFRTVQQEQHSIAAAISQNNNYLTRTPTSDTTTTAAETESAREEARQAHQKAYDAALTPRIWDLATTGANPSVDLLICLERHRPIGFSYSEVGAKPSIPTLGEKPAKFISSGPTGAEVDGNQWPGMGVVIHHGTKDGRVPVENVRWLGGRMVRCEVRELEGRGHGLMGEAGVMGMVLAEVAREAREARGWGSASVGRRR